MTDPTTEEAIRKDMVQTPSSPAAPAIGQPGSLEVTELSEARRYLQEYLDNDAELLFRKEVYRRLLRALDEQAATIREAVAEIDIIRTLPIEECQEPERSTLGWLKSRAAAFVSKHKEPPDDR